MKNLILLLFLFGACFGFTSCSAPNLCLYARKLIYPTYGTTDPTLTNQYGLYYLLCQKFNNYAILMFHCQFQARYACSLNKTASQGGVAPLGSYNPQDLCYRTDALTYPVSASNSSRTIPRYQSQRGLIYLLLRKLSKQNCLFYNNQSSLSAACQFRPKYACISSVATTSAQMTATTKVTALATTVSTAATAPEYTGDLCNGYSDYLTTYGIPSTVPCISGTDYNTTQCASNTDYPEDCTVITSPSDVTDLCDSAGGTIYFC